MQKTRMTKLLSLMLCMVLIAAMALFAGCGDKKDDNTVGEGEKTFTFIVVDAEGNEDTFTVKTDAKTVGEALLDEGLIKGEEGQYGLYVKEVNGIVADYDVDGTYWAFYIDGEYAMSGVDTTDVTDGATYSFKVEK